MAKKVSFWTLFFGRGDAPQKDNTRRGRQERVAQVAEYRIPERKRRNK